MAFFIKSDVNLVVEGNSLTGAKIGGWGPKLIGVDGREEGSFKIGKER